MRFNLLGSSPQFAHVLAQIRRVAGFDITVLVSGETGTGKELAARAVHYLGRRSEGPFIPVNCGALSESLLESELFGHERGAFTDARQAAPGLISEADGGTLFLDEIDALSSKAQASLLRFLQDGTYRRVGGTQMRHADVRLVTASNANLDALVESRRFRRDLLYRLKVLPLHMPPLRERAGDVPELAQTFLDRLNRRYASDMPAKRLHPRTLAALAHYDWPGNVRELEHFVQREFLMCEGRVIQATPGSDRVGQQAPAEETPRFSGDFREAKARAIAAFESDYVASAMKRAHGNISEAARMAGQDRSAFSKLVRKYRSKPATADKREKHSVDP
ncbi:sigma 54-interacting transcriptional regulator [Oleiagrimonas soli]|uniref:DNA-binding NtrC family response regulator n=1 Tax=Oleiagrimonas soli TaxID=1543381 RepID=A0A841KE76_9GAMM|nr:sigma-54 dependent transcriptional regulator [Oleiagrimonas soli]MBB6183235.1 DNA-binding NtrC family response regulator [Oleiagrimonas soli]